jgi:hypothetical protein
MNIQINTETFFEYQKRSYFYDWFFCTKEISKEKVEVALGKKQ